MIPFLQLVADDLVKKYGRDLSRLVVVFPNKRARLFMGEYLACHGTIWAPRYATISEMFSSLSDVALNDSIDTVCRMHRIYCKLTKTGETLDTFYGWGERLLADFNDADKNLADVKRLFTNVKDYKSIDFGDFMTEEEKKIIKSFFHQFDENNSTELKDNFLKLWNHMLPIYNKLNEELFCEGLAYEGALQRRCLEQLKSGMTPLPTTEETEKWVFVGFNVLDKVEQELMKFLHSCGRAIFYWDYDIAYANDDSQYEAGDFIMQNLRNFPNELPAGLFENMGHGQTLEFVSAPTENAQAFQTTDWLKEHFEAGKKNTAIVVCNEQMLEPILHVLPDEVDEVNVTKGFPLTHTTAFSWFVGQLNDMERKAPAVSNKDFLNALLLTVEDYAKGLATTGQQLKNVHDRDSMMQVLQQEACFCLYTILERLRNIAAKPYFEAERTILHRLITALARQTTVPFHGEPAAGLQIMGMLETRNLDFENILMLSVNEGVMPRPATDNSFIPYPLKAAFGLTLAKKKTAVYAYYFFRLLQRAHNVRLVYNNTADYKQTGEMSRYMTQLLLSGMYDIKHYQLTSRVTAETPRKISVEKPADLAERLNYKIMPDGSKTPQAISPSAINKYLDCPLQFYFNRIAHIRKPQDDTDEMDNQHFGTLFHDAAEILCRDAKEHAAGINYKTWAAAILGEADDRTLKAYIEKAYSKINAPRDMIAEVTVLGYLKQLLKADAALCDLSIIDLEKDLFTTISINVKGEKHTLRIGGRIDRLDVATNPDAETPATARTLRIVDYKTGSKVQEANNMDEIFHKKKNRPYYFLQTFLYALIAKEHVRELTGENLPVSTVLFYPSQYGREGYSPWVKYEKNPLFVFTDQIAEEFQRHLEKTLEEILNPDIPFKATDNDEACKHCDFRLLCGKREI